MKRLNIVILLALLALILVSKGNAPSITDKSIVHAVGIQGRAGAYSVTLQIFKPEAAGADTPVDISKANFKTVTAKGENIEKCLSELAGKAGGELFFGHLQLLVLGEDISFSDIDDITSFLRRDKSIYPGLYLACAENAGEIVSFPIKENAVTAENYHIISEKAAARGVSFLARLIDIDNALNECGCLALPYLEITGEEEQRCLSITGSRILGKNGFYEKGISPEECSLLSLLDDNRKASSPPYEIILGKQIIPVSSYHTDISFEKKGGRLICRADILAKANSVTGDIGILSKECSEQLKLALEERLKQDKTDAVRLFESVRFKEPALYAKYNGRLYELYSVTDFDVSVTLFLDSGL